MKIRILFLILQCSFIYSQSNYVSPNPSNFIRNNEVNNNEVIGSANFNIGLFDLRSDDLDFSVSITYQSNGIKIEEEAGDVGTSWNLNAGGLITRDIRSLPDEFENGYRVEPYPDPQIPCNNVLLRQNISILNRSDQSQEVAAYCIENNGQMLGYSGTPFASNGDTSPDIFKYFLPNGKKGQFVFDNFNEVVTSNNHLVKVFTSTQQIHKFEIIDDEGNKFIFDVVEKNNSSFWESVFKGTSSEQNMPIIPASLSWFNSMAIPPPFCQTGNSTEAISYLNRSINMVWFLSKIITNKAKEIVFTYEGLRHSKLSNTSTTYQQKSGSKFTNSNSYSNTISQKLKRIEFNNGYIEFNYKPSKREDVLNYSSSAFYDANEPFSELKALNDIKLFDKNNNLIKKVDFWTSYKISPGIENVGNNDKYLYKRLWLDKIIINDKEEYSFEYNQGVLPYKFSYEQDYWGYYNDNNAEENGKSMIPDVWFYPTDPRTLSRKTNFSIFRRSTFQGSEFKISNSPLFTSISQYVSNREINENVLQNGMLTKITYPTKGYDVINYESNDFLYENQLHKGCGLRISNIKSFDNNGSSVPIKQIDYTYKKSNNQSSGYLTELGTFGRIISMTPSTTNFFYSLNSGNFGRNMYYSRVEKSTPSAGKIVTDYFVPYTLDTENSLLHNGKYLFKRFSNINRTRISCYNAINCWIDNQWYGTLNTKEYTYRSNSTFDELFGYVDAETVFNSLGQEVQKTEYEYEFSAQSKIKIYYAGSTSNSTDPLFYQNWGTGTQYLNSVFLGKLNLKRKSITEKISGQTLSNATDYKYYDNGLLMESIYTNSLGENSTKRLKYPQHFKKEEPGFFENNGQWVPTIHKNIYQEMTDYNLINFPVEIFEIKDAKITNATINEFSQFNAIYYAKEIFGLENNQFNFVYTEADSNNTSSGLLIKSDKMKLKTGFVIDYYGNIIQENETNNIPVTFIWGYNNELPIAKIEGIASGEFHTLFYNQFNLWFTDLSAMSDLDLDKTTEQNFRNSLNLLRQVVIPNNKEVLITTYTHDPLVGITSITDPRGYTIFYEYDEMNKLSKVKDEEGNIITQHKYNYKN